MQILFYCLLLFCNNRVCLYWISLLPFNRFTYSTKPRGNYCQTTLNAPKYNLRAYWFILLKMNSKIAYASRCRAPDVYTMNKCIMLFYIFLSFWSFSFTLSLYLYLSLSLSASLSFSVLVPISYMNILLSISDVFMMNVSYNKIIINLKIPMY